MNITKEQAFEKVKQLVERFSEHIDEYKRVSYNEHQTRVDYINPFFKALGWDMDNEQGLAEAYREVIHEDKVKVGGATKAPDYAFTLYGQRKFFVDAKKPNINIKDDIGPAYQVRRYGWSAKVPVSVITDFEEFAIYDCTKKPNPTDKVSVSRIKYITYDQYLDEFDFLWDIFAKENLPKGRFDKYVLSDTSKKGTTTVDDAFLKSIEEWRTYLATSIALRNKSVSVDELNYAVQKTIDRIIFLRMCEDRGVEQYGLLKKAAEKGDVYLNLFALFRIANEKYNSGLFDFKEDHITQGLSIDNKVLKTIIGELYYPKCEYEFSVMPADILGSVYERFLGKTIRLTEAHHAKIEEKPEVRKAGGVYYTPKYVVDYIVENTVGKLIEGKTPKEVESIKICDPACGSGSFLIGAYQYLLIWHLKYYLTPGPSPGRRGEVLSPDGNLTTAEKKRILLNNIYGVDIDPQAVKVTKLNLLLKALEGETQASISQQLQLFHERVLPNLSQNIKCGNSLIGPDFYDNQLDLFSEQMKKINAFDWQLGFPEIFKRGCASAEVSAKAGFDVVIGNPPYVRSEFLPSEQKGYFGNRFQSAYKQYDIYVLFLERGIEILKNNGLLGYIVSNKFLIADYGKKVRQYLLDHTAIEQAIDVSYDQVFGTVAAYPYVLIFKKEESEIARKNNAIFYSNILTSETNFEVVQQKDFYKDDYIFDFTTAGNYWIKKMEKNTLPLGEITEITRGFRPPSSDLRQSKSANEKYLIGKDISGAYNFKWGGYLVEYDKDKIPESKPIQVFKQPKILFRDIGLKFNGIYDDEGYLCLKTIYFLYLENEHKKYSLKFILGLLNSTLLNKYFHLKFSIAHIRGGYLRYRKQFVEKFPIYQIDINISKEKEIHDQIVNLVNSLIKLNEQLQTTTLETQRQQIQRSIDHSEKKIDGLVYELYGSSEEEIGVIEGKG
ncbi:MAG: N-6 DNA methylase [Bacteroidales bacterium]|nr:N-6 DNA methylase [Bacteroidales bacterium]